MGRLDQGLQGREEVVLQVRRKSRRRDFNGRVGAVRGGAESGYRAREADLDYQFEAQEGVQVALLLEEGRAKTELD